MWLGLGLGLGLELGLGLGCGRCERLGVHLAHDLARREHRDERACSTIRRCACHDVAMRGSAGGVQCNCR